MLSRELFDTKIKIIDSLISALSKKSANRDKISVYSHYTSPEAALNIIKHKSFWMTHHRYQNDPSEIEYGKTLALKYLTKNISLNPLP